MCYGTNRFASDVALLCALAWIGLVVGQAFATEFDYTGNSCSFLGCDFNSAANWTPAGGPPSTGDIATIEMDDVIIVTANTADLSMLNIGGGADVYTLSSVLLVTNGVGFTEVVDDSRLLVQPDSFFSFVTDTLSLRLGGELRMQGGGAVATLVIRVSQTSSITGFGTVGVTANVGAGIDLAGTIRPEGGDLNVASTVAVMDLDGNSAGQDLGGMLDVIYDGDLIFTGTLADPFSGRVDIGNDNRVQFSTPLEMDGELNIISGTTNRLVAPTITFLTGTNITVQGSDGQFEGTTTFNSGSEVFLLNAADDLRLMGNSTIHSGAQFTGNGALHSASGGIMKLMDGANLDVRLFNTGAGELEIGAPIGSGTVGGYEQSASSDLEIQIGGLVAGDDFDQLVITGDAVLNGILDVSMTGGFILSPGQSFKILEIGSMRTGQFSGLDEGDLVGTFGDQLFITYNGGDGNDVVLFTIGLPGDFDGDGDVDGRDFLIWQRGGSFNPLSATDLAAWQANYGAAPLAALRAVPEPYALALVSLAAITLALPIRKGPIERWYL